MIDFIFRNVKLQYIFMFYILFNFCDFWRAWLVKRVAEIGFQV